jgi:hypothetical protein
MTSNERLHNWLVNGKPKDPNVVATIALRLLLINEFDTYSDASVNLDTYWRLRIQKRLIYRTTPKSEYGISMNYPNIAWPEMKEFAVMVEFLSFALRHLGYDAFKKHTIIYYGAAIGGGTAVPLIAQMFPDAVLHCWDTKKFDAKFMEFAAANPRQIKVFNEEFTEAYYSQYTAPILVHIHFLDNFYERLATTKIEILMDERRANTLSRVTMVRDLKPVLYRVDFAPNYDDGTFRYLPGLIKTKPFLARSSNECTIIGGTDMDGCDKLIDYDCREFEEIGAYHNCITRLMHIDLELFWNLNMMVINNDGTAQYYVMQDPTTGILETPDAWKSVWNRIRYDDWRIFGIMRDYILTLYAVNQGVKLPRLKSMEHYHNIYSGLSLSQINQAAWQRMCWAQNFLGSDQQKQNMKFLTAITERK